jgi:integrase
MSLNNIVNKSNAEDLVSQLDGTILVNRLAGNKLTMNDIVKDRDYVYDFYHQDLTPELQFYIKEWFVCLCGGWNNTESQTLSGRNSTARGWKSALLRIGVWASHNCPLLPLSQWTESHVSTLLVDVLNNDISWTEDTDKAPLGRGPVENVLVLLGQTRDFSLQGTLSDGLSFDFPKHFLQTALKANLERHGGTYDDWFNRGGWESIPLPVAMGLLHDACELLKDKKTLFLRDYFKYQRSERVYTMRQIQQGCFDTYCKGLWKNKKSARTRPEGLKKVVEKHYKGKITEFPFSMGDLSAHCEDVYDACIVIFLCLTGIRISELGSIYADDYKLEADGTWVFISELIKTNHGIPEAREMHGEVAKAADTLVDLSYIVKRKRDDKESLPLFGRYFYIADCKNHVDFRRTKRGATESALRRRLNTTYSAFIERHPEFEEHCPSIHPHRFRHTLAEFAIRRFEGNVFEALRRHFRHSFGSYFTTHYVFGKLSGEVREQIEKNYMIEILTKIATENAQSIMDDDFKRDMHGKAVNAISRAMGETILTLEEVDDFVEGMADEFESFIAHEYGYCLVRKKTKHLSKCLDAKTQTPILKDGCFKLCSGCPHFLASESSNKESIIRIAVSHTNMIESFTNLMGDNVKSQAIETSKAVVKQAGVYLDAMRE